MSVLASAPPATTSPQVSVGARSVLVGVTAGGLNGIDTYAEQVAAAWALAGCETTLLATTSAARAELARRLAPYAIRVVDIGLTPAGPIRTSLERIWPGLAISRIERAMQKKLSGFKFDVAHLNHPALALAVRPSAARVIAAAWFYPHDSRRRIVETWHHTGGRFPSSLIFAAKSVSHYMNDQRGFEKVDMVLAPTTLLARQLSDRGIASVVCPPPVSLAYRAQGADGLHAVAPDREEICVVMCSADLGHPRKNLQVGLSAIGELATRLGERRIRVEIIGRNPTALAGAVARLPRNVRVGFLGRLSPAHVQERLGHADALLLPSLFEEWGYVAIEALLCGAPVVTLPVYPFHELLAGGFGQTARDHSVAALAEALGQVLSHGRPPGMAESAAARFGVEAASARLQQVLLDLDGRTPRVGKFN